jgi:hypothetical protein
MIKNFKIFEEYSINSFKKGDYVKCIYDETLFDKYLKKDKIYIVTSTVGEAGSDKRFIKIDNYPQLNNIRRFVKATEKEIEEYKFNNAIKNYNI